MKTYILLLVFAAALCSCGKKNKFECDIQTVTQPATDSATVFIPTAFSPNGDGLNDRFFIPAKHIKSIHWEVYNPENELQFTTDDLKAYWAPANTFGNGLTLLHYKLTARTNAGNTISHCGDFYVYTCVPKGFSMKDIVFGDQYDPNMPEGYLKGSSYEVFTRCKD